MESNKKEDAGPKQRYQLILSGDMLPDHNVETIRLELARKYSLNNDQASILFPGNRVVLETNMELDAALESQLYLRQIGATSCLFPVVKSPFIPESLPSLKGFLQENQPDKNANSESEKIACPKCESRQTFAEKCFSCGIYFHKYDNHSVQIENDTTSGTGSLWLLFVMLVSLSFIIDFLILN